MNGWYTPRRQIDRNCIPSESMSVLQTRDGGQLLLPQHFCRLGSHPIPSSVLEGIEPLSDLIAFVNQCKGVHSRRCQQLSTSASTCIPSAYRWRIYRNTAAMVTKIATTCTCLLRSLAYYILTCLSTGTHAPAPAPARARTHTHTHTHIYIYILYNS